MNSIMELSIKASGQKMVYVTVVVFKFGKMVLNMKDIGVTIWQMEKVDLFIVMETFTRVNGLMTKHMAKEPIFIWMVRSTLANGLKTSSMATVLRHGQTVLVMKEITNMVRSMERAPLSGLTHQCSSVNSTIITSMGRAFTCGVTAVSTKVNGRIIKCMVKAALLGLTAVCTLVNTWMIRKTVTVNSVGLMAEATKEIG